MRSRFAVSPQIKGQFFCCSSNIKIRNLFYNSYNYKICRNGNVLSSRAFVTVACILLRISFRQMSILGKTRKTQGHGLQFNNFYLFPPPFSLVIYFSYLFIYFSFPVCLISSFVINKTIYRFHTKTTLFLNGLLSTLVEIIRLYGDMCCLHISVHLTVI
jgi:hypothetical protein